MPNMIRLREISVGQTISNFAEAERSDLFTSTINIIVHIRAIVIILATLANVACLPLLELDAPRLSQFARNVRALREDAIGWLRLAG